MSMRMGCAAAGPAYTFLSRHYSYDWSSNNQDETWEGTPVGGQVNVRTEFLWLSALPKSSAQIEQNRLRDLAVGGTLWGLGMRMRILGGEDMLGGRMRGGIF